MGIAKAFGTSQDAETNGKWLDVPDPDTGKIMFGIKLARYGGQNTRLSTVRERVMEPYRHLPPGALDDKISARLGLEVFVEACVLDWDMPADRSDVKYPPDLLPSARKPTWVRGVEQADGTVLPFDVGAVMQLFSDVPEVLGRMISQASQFAFYKQAQREVDSKNS